MNLARGLELRLEKLADGVSASVFRGTMHPIDIASRLIRQVEFLSVDTHVGPEVPNDLVVRLNPADLDEALDRDELVAELENAVTETAAEQGWRLVGPVRIQFTTTSGVPRGILQAEGRNRHAPISPWGQLLADDGSAVLSLSLNRTLIGRALDCDVRVANQEVSRHHVLFYRKSGAAMARDLESANGTCINGVALTALPVSVNAGDSVMLGELTFVFRPLF
ncbi:MAG: DUF3662 and FHA domain-containing protein [Actinomycetota bacterium]|nr:DUF3662 and FHA domain-containing protein [Actinomycetota bacterium]